MRSQLFADPLRHGEMVRLLNEHSVLPSFEAQMRRSDGIARWISLDVRTVRDDHGSVLFHEGTMRDITKRKLAEEALAESEERYRTVIEHSNDGIAIVHDGRHLFVNRRFVEMFGYTDMDEIIGEPIIRLVHPDDRERVAEINDRRKKGERVPERYEFKGVTRDGGTLRKSQPGGGPTGIFL
jgi:PAS domain S-box-containing protein